MPTPDILTKLLSAGAVSNRAFDAFQLILIPNQ